MVRRLLQVDRRAHVRRDNDDADTDGEARALGARDYGVLLAKPINAEMVAAQDHSVSDFTAVLSSTFP